MPVTTPPPATLRPAPGRAALTALVLAVLVLPACSGASGDAGPSSATTAPSSSATNEAGDPPAPSASSSDSSEVPAGWSRHDVDGISFALPPGMVETGSKEDQGDRFVNYDDGAVGGDALVWVTVRTGPQLPFEVLDEAQVSKANATLGQEPTSGPGPLPVPGTDRVSTTTWLWTGGDPTMPRRTTYAYVEARPGLRYFLQVGGPQESWSEEEVQTFLGSVSVGEGSA